MPWSIEERDGRFCVVKDADGVTVACHDTREEAVAQQRALYANEDQMSEGLYGLSFFELADQPEGDPPRSFIQVLIAGTFNHPSYGKFTISDEDLAGYAEDISARAERILIDFDHASADGQTRAGGWYTGRTRIGADSQGRQALFAEVEWTPGGAAAVRSKEYRFISIEANLLRKVWRDATGAMKKGYRVAATALTNRPFLPDMDPVTLSASSLDDLKRIRTALAETLGLSEDADLAPILQRIGVAMSDKDDTTQTQTDTETKTDTESVAASTTTEGEVMDKTILALLDLPEHADDATVKAAIAAKDEQIAALTEQVTSLAERASGAAKLAERVSELEARDRNREIDVILKDEVRAGRVYPGELDQLAITFANDVDGLKALVNARPPGMFADRLRERGSGGNGIVSDPSVRAVNREMGTDEYSVDEDSAHLHLAAIDILRSQGKEHGYSQEEYAAALTAASDTHTVLR